MTRRSSYFILQKLPIDSAASPSKRSSWCRGATLVETVCCSSRLAARTTVSSSLQDRWQTDHKNAFVLSVKDIAGDRKALVEVEAGLSRDISV